MKRFTYTIVLTLALLALIAVPVVAGPGCVQAKAQQAKAEIQDKPITTAEMHACCLKAAEAGDQAAACALVVPVRGGSKKLGQQVQGLIVGHPADTEEPAVTGELGKGAAAGDEGNAAGSAREKEGELAWRHVLGIVEDDESLAAIEDGTDEGGKLLQVGGLGGLVAVAVGGGDVA